MSEKNKKDSLLPAEMQGLDSEAIALCPLDGRYSDIRDLLAPYFSEYALVKNRVLVEVDWLTFLLENVDNNEILSQFPKDKIPEIMKIYDEFDATAFNRVKAIEFNIKHDVNAAQRYVAEQLVARGMGEISCFVHIGCTSEDITNVAYANMLKGALCNIWLPKAYNLINILGGFAKEYADVPMLSHTHGQPATPTTVGKEFSVFTWRLQKSLEHLESVDIMGKFNGATGNYSAISLALPGYDWIQLCGEFIESKMDLTFKPVTTQIESHDYMARLFDAMSDFSGILLDFVRDIWLYICLRYFGQKPVEGEVGSSTMPHKVNPIAFENAEGNLIIAISLFRTLADSLVVSRMQRDLSDSTKQRNIGLAFGYSLKAILETQKGLSRVTINQEILSRDLENNWEVLAEAIQQVLRTTGDPEAYDKVKTFTRGKEIDRIDILSFIEHCDELSDEQRKMLLDLAPDKYTGYAGYIADLVVSFLS